MNLKQQVSHILSEALSGRNLRYRTEDGFIRWGRVESDIHEKIDAYESSEKPCPICKATLCYHSKELKNKAR